MARTFVRAVGFAVCIFGWQSSAVAHTYKGRIVAEDGSVLPETIHFQRRVSGESSKETIATNGEFQFETAHGSSSARYEIRLPGFAPMDTKWMKFDRPIEIKLSRGANVELNLQSDHPIPASAKVSVNAPWWDTELCGEFQIEKSRQSIVVPLCPKTTIDFDLQVPGFEEMRIRRWIKSDTAIDVQLKRAKPTKLTVVDVKTGDPIRSAKVHFAKRVAADTFLNPFVHWGKPIWAESDSDGSATLDTLREFVPKASDQDANLKASYAFCIRADGYADRWIGDVQPGEDLGIVKMEAALTLRGEIELDDPKSDQASRVSVQYRQDNVIAGGDDGIEPWRRATLVKKDGKLHFELDRLQSGRLDFYVVYREPVKQKAFFGKITADSRVEINRNGLVSLSDGFVGKQGSAHSSQQFPPSNLPTRVSREFVPSVSYVSNKDGTTTVKTINANKDLLLYWSSTAPIRHSSGHVSWRVFIAKDGTLFVPGQQREAGVRYKMSEGEIDKVLSVLIAVRRDGGDLTLPAGFNSWEQGHETVVGTIKNKTFTWRQTDFKNGPHSIESITDHLLKLITHASCGGPEQKKRYLQLANKVLLKAAPDAAPFESSDWCSASNTTDGNREISLSNGQRYAVRLLDPAEGPVYVTRIEQNGAKIEIPEL